MQNVVKTNHRPIAKVGDDSYTFIVQRTRTTEILSKHFFFFFFSAYEQWMRMDSPYRRQSSLFTYCLCTVHGSHDTIYIFKNYFVIVFSVFSKINYIQIDPKTNIRRDMWILFGGMNWYICRASLFYIVLYRGFKSFGGPWPPVRIGFVDLLCSWIRGQLGLQNWEKGKNRERKGKGCIGKYTLLDYQLYTTHWSLIQHQKNCQWPSVSDYSNWLT